MKQLGTTLLLLLLAACGGTSTDTASSGAAPAAQVRTTQSKALANATLAINAVTIAGYRDNYSITKSASSVTVTDLVGTTGTKTYTTNPVLLRFIDKHVSFDIAGTAGQVYRLYRAAFNRVPDLAGLGWWIDHMDKGMSLTEVSGHFQGSDEFKNLYGTDVPAGTFITLLYQNVLHRTPEQAGFDHWMNILSTGQLSRQQVLVYFSESQENQTQVLSAIANGINYLPIEQTVVLPQATVSASIASVLPAKITGTSYEGMSPPSATLTAQLSGDLQSLNGKTIYLLIQLPHADLFEKRPQLQINSQARTATVVLTGALNGATPAGTYQNTLRIYACLDPTCATQLGGSPYAIPYDITILPGLKLTPSDINFSTTYGKLPSPQTIQVQLPPGTTSWSISPSPVNAFGIYATKGTGATPSIVVSAELREPFSSYKADFTVIANVTNPNAAVALPFGGFQRTFHVNYTVAPDSTAGAVLSPSSMSATQKAGAQSQPQQMFNVFLQGGSLSYAGVTYLSAPAAAASNPNVTKWVSANLTGAPLNQIYLIPCGFYPLDQCLPAGTYTATIQYRYTSASGAVSIIDYPVELILTP